VVLGILVAGLANAEPPDAGSGAIRATAGGGLSDLGGAARLGAEAEVWLAPRAGLGVRGATGVDGLTAGRTFVLGEATVPLRPLGGEELSIVILPGLGAAWHSSYLATPRYDGDVVFVDAETLPQGFAPSGSVAALVYGQMGFVNVTLGPRVETVGFEDASVTGNLGLGVGW
jgi:hypothetical protein